MSSGDAEDNTIRLWDPVTGDQSAIIKNYRVRTLAFRFLMAGRLPAVVQTVRSSSGTSQPLKRPIIQRDLYRFY